MSPFCVHRNSLLMLPGLEQKTLHDLTKPHYRSQTAVYTRFLIYYSLYTIYEIENFKEVRYFSMLSKTYFNQD